MYGQKAKIVHLGSNNDQCYIQNRHPCYKEVHVYFNNDFYGKFKKSAVKPELLCTGVY